METFAGERAHDFLTQIMAKRHNLHVQVSGTEQGIISTIIKLPVERGKRYVVMAGRDDFLSPALSSHDPMLVCEFMDNQGIRYRFSTKLYKVENDEIWGCFPDRIIRMQRRQHVRVAVPSESCMRIQVEGELRHPAIKDISLGGLTVVIPRVDKKLWHIKEGDKLTDITLLLSLKDEWTEISIKSAVVRRAREDLKTGDRLCSLQFTSLDYRVQKLLAIHILRCERHLIRKARGLDDEE